MRNPWKKLISNMRINGRAWRERKGRDMTKEIQVTPDDLQEIFLAQNSRCYWFDIPLDPFDIFTSYNPLAISVDRLDAQFGYSKENIVICSRMANLGRGQCSADKFAEIVTEFRQRVINDLRG